MEEAPIVTLSSGVRVANFSSPHPFKFDDGSTLPACSAARANALMLNAQEVERPNPFGKGLVDLELSFEMSEVVHSELCRLMEQDIDIILVPLPVLKAQAAFRPGEHNLRTCRVVDRVTKTISSTKFCL